MCGKEERGSNKTVVRPTHTLPTGGDGGNFHPPVLSGAPYTLWTRLVNVTLTLPEKLCTRLPSRPQESG